MILDWLSLVLIGTALVVLPFIMYESMDFESQMVDRVIRGVQKRSLFLERCMDVAFFIGAIGLAMNLGGLISFGILVCLR